MHWDTHRKSSVHVSSSHGTTCKMHILLNILACGTAGYFYESCNDLASRSCPWGPPWLMKPAIRPFFFSRCVRDWREVPANSPPVPRGLGGIEGPDRKLSPMLQQIVSNWPSPFRPPRLADMMMFTIGRVALTRGSCAPGLWSSPVNSGEDMAALSCASPCSVARERRIHGR